MKKTLLALMMVSTTSISFCQEKVDALKQLRPNGQVQFVAAAEMDSLPNCITVLANGKPRLRLSNAKKGHIALQCLPQASIDAVFDMPKNEDGDFTTVHDIMMLSNDSVIMQTDLQLYFASIFDGTIIDSVAINSFDSLGNWPATLIVSADNNFSPPFHTATNKMFFYSSKGGAAWNEKVFYESNCITSFNVGTRTFEELPIAYPPQYLESYIPHLDVVSSASLVGDSCLLVGWAASPSIALYNIYTKKTKYFDVAHSSHDLGTAKKFQWGVEPPMNEVVKNIANTFLYGQILYIPKHNSYVRICRDNYDANGQRAEYQYHFEKPRILQVFDEKFNLLKEYSLSDDKKYATNTMYCDNSNLYIETTANEGSKTRVLFDAFPLEDLFSK